MEVEEIKKNAEELGAQNVVDAKPFGNGHINDTYQIITVGQRYILQKINTDVFPNTDGMMNNIKMVTEHLVSKGKRTFSVIGYKKPWRLITFIGGTYSLDVLTNIGQATTAAEAFAAFQNDLSDFPAEKLVEVIPDFHNTVVRLQQLDDAASADVKDRLKNIRPEMDFVDAHRGEASKILDLIAEGKIPIRITHNDTKINNVMLDIDTGNAVAVVDLDTVMPGCALYDFGDMVRTATASAAEDERDLSKVYSKFSYFMALVNGYLNKAKFLNEYEIENLVFSGRLITFTIGIRFLADYLKGDVYFKTDYEDHNLVRARNQFKMVQSMEEQKDEYDSIVNVVKLGVRNG